MTPPGQPTAATPRRVARADAMMEVAAAPVRHARARRAERLGAGFAAVLAAVLAVGSVTAVAAAVTGPALAADVLLGPGAGDAAGPPAAEPLPETVAAIPAPTFAAVPATEDVCALDGVQEALAAGDDAAVIERAGGGEAFRAAVVSGAASCIELDDPGRVWVVVNKQRAFDPIDVTPSPLAQPAGVRNIVGAALREDAAQALSAMVAAAAGAGAGELALDSGYRSYRTQQSSYGRQVSTRGVDGADLVSARPGYSEHQSGLAGDLRACDGGCGSIDELAATAQGAWIVEHAWEYGWIVRYEDGCTDVTGYLPEPWHLRYIGPSLARAYHDGGWHTLEQFFGLPAAADYAD